ncbi:MULTISPECIES: hypothetical protein [unclassified Synechococcus]|uniref:hypothetical protein n=1 Tax=unclassified Synechococcus TaxID=2626047 RepID=UPI0021A68033|nr:MULTISPECIES: hypothetical protein [unclassified Synechococcus]MCT0212152.1 hypothetical protein [Synechococcus sp. CS-1326]
MNLKPALWAAALMTAVSGCSQPSATKSPPSGSALLEPIERAKQAAQEIEAQQLERQKAVLDAPQ